MKTKTAGDWVFERSSGHAGYRCKKCADWVYQGQPLKCKCGEKEVPMSIIDWFNPEDIDHLRAYEFLVRTEKWPEGFVPVGLDWNPGWFHVISQNIALKHALRMIDIADNKAEVEKRKKEIEDRRKEEKDSRPKADRVLELMRQGWTLYAIFPPNGAMVFRISPPEGSDRSLRVLKVHSSTGRKLLRYKQIEEERNSEDSLLSIRRNYRLK